MLLSNSKVKQSRDQRKAEVSSFVYGMGGVLNITGDYFQKVHSFRIPTDDSESIAGDWQAIGRDINTAIRKADERR